jgi:hypothetical protein
MSQQKVKAAVINAVKTRLALLGGANHTAWPNKRYQPGNALWYSVHYVPNNPTPVTLGSQGEDNLQGFVQIDVNILTDTGEKTQTDALNSLEAWFVAGRKLTFDGQSVVVTSAARAQGMNSGAYWKVPLSIYFYARYQRPLLT